MCGGEVVDNRCSCGIWFGPGSKVPLLDIFQKAIYAYDWLCEQQNSDFPMTGSHHMGIGFVFFKGDEALCDKVKEFINKENGKG
jgi:hypothetical protein